MNPNLKSQRNPFVLAGIVFAVIVIITIIITLVVNNNHKKATGPGSPSYNIAHQGPERGGPPAVVISGSGLDRLYQVLLSQQYSAVKTELNSYILTKVSPKTVSAQVLNTAVNQDGSVTFSVQTAQPSQNFTVNLDRSKTSTIGFSVPSTGFQQTLNIYGPGSGD